MPMVGIEMQQPSPEFATCWQAAARYLQKQVQRGGLSMGVRRARQRPGARSQ